MSMRYSMAVMITATALLAPGLYLEAADTDDQDKDRKETMGEKMDDTSITTKVKMKLLSNKATSALNTKVETVDGVVTLTGKAKSTAEKELATQLAQEVKGVKSVNNGIKIDESTKSDKKR